MMKRALWVGVPILALLTVVALMFFAAQGASMPVIDTKGVIADSQRDTLFLAVAIMSIIIIPVFVLTFLISVRYRETNKKARYSPNWSSNKILETIWWGVPILIVAVLSVITWQTSHSLDPYKPLVSEKPAINVQVVSLQWKWLFIYPDYGVASVGEFAMPVDTPVAFKITSDAPMNSFWIPQLGGQIYAMSGMSTSLHLSARETGDYRGSSANLSGEGHKEMTFIAKARSDSDFYSWIENTRKSGKNLDTEAYNVLREPSRNNKVNFYRLANESLFEEIINRYDSHGHGSTSTQKVSTH